MKATPGDSRYIPLTQQKSCCVPTCFQIIMLKNNLPLTPAEELGYHLGLTVKPERKHLFYRVRVSKKIPKAGYGTRISDKRYNPNVAFKRLNIPLSFHKRLIGEFSNIEKVKKYLEKVERRNSDVLLCFDHGTLVSDFSYKQGHVVVFDRLIKGKIRFIDPSPDYPKWGFVTIEKMFQAMKNHGNKNSGGFWEINKRKITKI